MNEILNCRFLTTVQTMSDEDITPSELEQQLSEFISLAKALLCGQDYLEVSDTYDTLVMHFDKVLGRKKKVCSRRPQRMPGTKSSSIRTTMRNA
ncbi:MAG: hypothetical protein IJK20_00805 [Bacteroidales bacterium]|nr:hypothetical protein [Bacteroidales bacterium]